MYLRFVYSMSHVADMPFPASYWDKMLEDMCELEGIWKELHEFFEKDKAAEEAEAKAAEETEAKAAEEAKAKADEAQAVKARTTSRSRFLVVDVVP